MPVYLLPPSLAVFCSMPDETPCAANRYRLAAAGLASRKHTGTARQAVLRLHRRRDTDGRRRVTKLPKPCPQYPPFTLRDGNMPVLPALQLMAIPALPAPVTGPSDCRSCL